MVVAGFPVSGVADLPNECRAVGMQSEVGGGC